MILLKQVSHRRSTAGKSMFKTPPSRSRSPQNANAKAILRVIVARILIAFLGLVLIVPSTPTPAAQAFEPFFLMGGGKLHLKNLRNGQEARVELRNTDGSLNDAAFTEVDRVFGFPTAEKGEHVSPRLLFMLSYFADQVAPGEMITMESGYRSPDYNDKIRKKGANAARTSTHMDGMALDFWIEGIDGKKLWQIVREKDCCGVGHYGGKTIHLDCGRPRFWEAATSGTKSKEPDYNRHIYLSTDFDRYRLQEKVRLSLSGISTFGFGVKPTVSIYGTADSDKPVAQVQIKNAGSSDCLMIDNRKASYFLFTTIPADLPAGTYRAKLDFCEKPFVQMPEEVMSNEIELFRPAGK
jgi:uncharacterized protein YcbK (DUF882 family)